MRQDFNGEFLPDSKPTARELLDGEAILEAKLYSLRIHANASGHTCKSCRIAREMIELASRIERVLERCHEAERARISRGIISADLILRLLNGEEA